MQARGEQAAELPVGASVGRYLVTHRVAAGAMGVVYEAFDPELERRVAVKLLRPDLLSRRTSIRERLLREAQALAMVDHPNVVRVFDVGAVADSIFVAMEYVHGRSGRDWLRDAPPADAVLDAFIEAARGLSAIHRAGLVHRDFKPGNIMIGHDGHVRVLDLGLARAAGAASDDTATTRSRLRSGLDTITQESRHWETSTQTSGASRLQEPLTMTGATVGTPPYMAPEQHAGDSSDARADQFAFCVALYEALAGVRPFRGRTPAELAKAKRARRIVPPPRRHAIPPAIGRVLARGLRPRPSRRYPTMTALIAALQRARSPHRVARRLAIGVGVVAILGTAAWSVDAWHTSPGCDPEQSRMSTIWNGERAEALREHFAATDLAFADDAWKGTHARVERFADEWSDAWTQACGRTGGDPPEPRDDLTTTCLAQRLDELQARLSILETGTPRAVEHAVRMVEGLRSPAECLSQAPRDDLPPEPPVELADEVEEIDRLLAESRALQDAGEYTRAIERAGVAVAEAQTLDWAPLVARAQHQQGRALTEAGEGDAAVTPLREAAILAASEGLHAEATRAAIDVVLALQSERPAAAELWLRRAEAYLRRVGEPAELRRAWLSAAGLLDLTRDRPQRAYDELNSALELTRELHGEHDAAVARALDNLALAAHRRGLLDEAMQRSAQALAIMEDELGPHHPEIGRALINAGSLALGGEDYERAVPLYERALAIHRAAFGPRTREVAFALDGLGYAMSGLGRHEDALRYLRAALSIFEARSGPDHRDCATARLSIGRTLLGMERFDEALVELRRAHEDFVLAYGPQHSAVAASLNDVGVALQYLGRKAEAHDTYAEALAILDTQPDSSPAERAKMLGNLAMLSIDAHQHATARRELLRALALLDDPEHADPLVIARLRVLLAEVQLELGEPARALPVVELAIAGLSGVPSMAEDLREAQETRRRAREALGR